jgi:hypothetical protein
MAQSLTYLFSEQARIQADIDKVTAQLAYARANSNPGIIAGLEQRLTSDQELLSEIQNQIQIAQTESATPTSSSGAVVTEEQKARANDATTQTPQATPDIIVRSDQVNQNIEFGTDGRVRTLTETQSTPAAPEVAYTPVAELDNSNIQAPAKADAIGSTSAGVGAPSDDSGASKNAVRTDVDNAFKDSKIIPQPNVLDQYASYTYVASVYLMSPEGFQQIIKSKKKSLPGAQLLFQSGGAPVTGRNDYFSDDYYIDKITIDSAITGKGTNQSHNAVGIKMTVIEPAGITLLNNLNRAVTAYLGSAPGGKSKNFQSQIYLLVIRFYGYDDAGNLVRGGTKAGGGTDPSAFVEKFYPMNINSIQFKVANKLVEYEIQASPSQYQISAGQNRGSIPYNIELSALTVKEALSGPTNVTAGRATTTATPATGVTGGTNTNQPTRENGTVAEGESPIVATPPAPQTANAATNPKLTIRQGLMTALNQYQADLVDRGIYTYPDNYSIEFVNSSIESAKITVKGGDNKGSGMPIGGTAKDKVDPGTQSKDPNSRLISFTAGAQIVQVIDQVLKNCDYISAQANISISEKDGKQTPNGTPGKNVAWYKVSFQATPTKWDPKRNDYAYDVKYIVSSYKINQLVSPYFSVPTYNGVHKQYNYWFTGENTAVLSYEQNFNALYTTVMSSQNNGGSTVVNDAVKQHFYPRSGESSQGAAGRTNEIGANAADYLYNPGDLANAKLTIIGDPAWLQQGEAFSAPGKSNWSFQPFLPDGTINFDSQQILFEILINTPRDYDLNTGIFDPNQQSTVFQNGSKKPGASKQSYVYIANKCVSEFNKGKFTQNLEGSGLVYYPDQTFKEKQDLGRLSNPNATSASAASNTAGDATRTGVTPATTANATTGSSSATLVDSASEGDAAQQWEQQNGVLVATEAPGGPATPEPSPPPNDPTSSGDITVIPSENGDIIAPADASRINAGDVEIAGVNTTPQTIAREA